MPSRRSDTTVPELPRTPRAFAEGEAERRVRAAPAELQARRGDAADPVEAPRRGPLAVDEGRSKQGDDLDALPRWLTRGAPALLLLGVTIYSLVALLDIAQEGEGEGLAAAPSRGGGTTGGAAAALPDEASAPSKAPSLLARGTPAGNLLGLSLERLRGDGGAAFVDLDEVIAGGQVTVVNLWGAWCEPCKRELPELKRMFDRASWGEKVAFVSIHTPTEDPRAAHAEFAGLMPNDKAFMIEIEAGSVSAALREDGAITKAGLPITLVLDCRREIRLPHVGELSSADFEELRPLIDQLVDELDTPFCVKATVAPAKKRKKPQPSGPSTGPSPAPTTGPTTGPAVGATTGPAEPAKSCGDGRCDPTSESCRSCAADCGCQADSTCSMKQEGGDYACIKNASALKFDD